MVRGDSNGWETCVRNVIEACNELILVTRNRAEASQREEEIESVRLDIRRISQELDAAKLEGKGLEEGSP
ncbi:hypothetical protein Bca101_068564 [Brassica carinata]